MSDKKPTDFTEATVQTAMERIREDPDAAGVWKPPEPMPMPLEAPPSANAPTLAGGEMLGKHVGACQRESGMMLGGDGPAFAAFCEDMVANDELRDAVMKRLAGLDEGVLARDHISRWLKDALERALRRSEP